MTARPQRGFNAPEFPAARLTGDPRHDAIDLSWTDSSITELGFKIERKEGAGGSWAEITSGPPNDTSYSDANRPPGTYFYRIRIYNDFGASGYADDGNTEGITLVSQQHCLYYYKWD